MMSNVAFSCDSSFGICSFERPSSWCRSKNSDSDWNAEDLTSTERDTQLCIGKVDPFSDEPHGISHIVSLTNEHFDN